MADKDSTFVQFGEVPQGQGSAASTQDEHLEPEKRPRKKKNVPAILITILAIIAIAALAWFCWGKDYLTGRVIEHEVNQQFSQLKEGDVSSVVDNTAAADDFFSTYQIDKTEFFQAYFDGFDYSIDQVFVEGDHAVVRCTLTTKNISSVSQSALSEVFSIATVNDFFTDADEGVNATIGSAILTGVKSASDYATLTVDIDIDKVDGQWKVTNMDQVVSLIMVGGDATSWIQNMIQTTTDGISSLSSSMGSFFSTLTSIKSQSGTETTTGSSNSTTNSTNGSSTTNSTNGSSTTNSTNGSSTTNSTNGSTVR